jgi:hypothetical protein
LWALTATEALIDIFKSNLSGTKFDIEPYSAFGCTSTVVCFWLTTFGDFGLSLTEGSTLQNTSAINDVLINNNAFGNDVVDVTHLRWEKSVVPILEESFNFCCTPWTKNALESSFQIITEPGGGLNADFTFEYQGNATTNTQIDAYVNYLKTIKPTIDNLTVDFELKDYGGDDLPSSGGGTPIPGLIQPGVQSVTWPSGVPSTSFWDGFPMQVNHWYGIHSRVNIIDNEGVALDILDEECKDPDLFVRIQVINSRSAIAEDRNSRTLGRAIMQISDGKVIIKSIPFN